MSVVNRQRLMFVMCSSFFQRPNSKNVLPANVFLKPLLRGAAERLLNFPCLPSHQNVRKQSMFSYFRPKRLGSSGFRASLKLEAHKMRSPLASPSYFHVISSSDSPTLLTARCKNASPRNVSGLFCTDLLLLFLLCLCLP